MVVLALNINNFLLIIDTNLCYGDAMSDSEPSDFLCVPGPLTEPEPSSVPMAPHSPHTRRPRVVGKPVFWWALGDFLLISSMIVAHVMGSLYPSYLFLAGRVFQDFEVVRTVFTLGATSWLISIVVALKKKTCDAEHSPEWAVGLLGRVMAVLKVLVVTGISALNSSQARKTPTGMTHTPSGRVYAYPSPVTMARKAGSPELCVSTLAAKDKRFFAAL